MEALAHSTIPPPGMLPSLSSVIVPGKLIGQPLVGLWQGVTVAGPGPGLLSRIVRRAPEYGIPLASTTCPVTVVWVCADVCTAPTPRAASRTSTAIRWRE